MSHDERRVVPDRRRPMKVLRGGKAPRSQVDLTHQATERREQEAARAHRSGLWTRYANTVLGAWLIATPASLGSGSAAWAWSAAASGALVILFSALTVSARFDGLRWGTVGVGFWLLFAPLVFWAPTPAEYLNDTLVGSLIIVFALLIPGVPAAASRQEGGPDSPPGWSSNPSSWIERGPIIALALLGFFIGRYLTAYQLGHIPTAWDPFFGAGTVVVLTSEVSRAWPISDAGLGAVTYLLEVLTGFLGDEQRWRTMPWVVILFGLLVVPLGIVSIVLIILQPLAIGAWCTLCLVAALVMLLMVSPALDEVIATGQFLAQGRRDGRSIWRTFFVGGTMGQFTAQGPSEEQPRSRSSQILAAMGWTTVPRTLVTSAVLGAWVMASPAIWRTQGLAADSDHLVGALVVTWSVIAIADIGRSARWLNVPLGVWLIIAPWVLPGAGWFATLNDFLAGVAVVVLSAPRGRVDERFGSWNRYIR